ncbi:YycH family regulatory protein [Enterococcus sp. LJL98]
MNRIGDKLLHFILLVMIGLSFYLTYLIWVSPVGRDIPTENNPTKELAEKKPQKKQEEMFLPLKLRYQTKEANKETQSENLLKSIQLLLKETSYSDGKKVEEKNRLDYQRQTTLTNGFELAYALAFPLKSYLELFEMDLALPEEELLQFKFTKIQIDFDQSQIRFLNDKKFHFVEATLEDDWLALLEVFKNSDSQWRVLENTYTYLDTHYLTTEPLKLKQYSYISSTRPYTLFRDAFFANPKSVRSNSSAFDTYLYESGESLTIKQNQEVINFQGNAQIVAPFDIFSTSFRYMQRIGTSYGSTRMLDQTRNEIDYRIFVEGFPVFGSNSAGRLLFDFKENNSSNEVNVSIQGNLTSLQIPIPSAEEVTLPASQEVVETLYYNGFDVNLVQMLLIGYEWKNLEDTGVVDLIPQWYIKYGDKWFSYDFLLSTLMEEERE